MHSDLMVATLLIYGNHDKFVTLEEETCMLEVPHCSNLRFLIYIDYRQDSTWWQVVSWLDSGSCSPSLSTVRGAALCFWA